MGVDFNVRSTLWFDHRNDNRAATLEKLIATNNLTVVHSCLHLGKTCEVW
jgi:hypothetical protein